jgi:hypothetical protein
MDNDTPIHGHPDPTRDRANESRGVQDPVRVRAKFKCVSVTEQEGGLKTATLQPVTNGSPENASFFKWTPSGQIQLGTINPSAAKEFVPGREFYIDFTPAN